MKGINPIEFGETEEMRAHQERLLREHIGYAHANSPYYARIFREAGLRPGEICLDNLSMLPFTDKSAFEKCNDELLAVPLTKVVDIVMSSGTTGQPKKMCYTEYDLKRLAYNEEISLAGCGLTRDDTVLLTCTLDRCFIAGLAYYLGLRNLGAAVIRNGISSVTSHFNVIRLLRPTAIVGVPTFLKKLGFFFESKGEDPRRSGIKKLICIGEPIRDKDLRLLRIGELLEETWGAKAYSTYASTETITTFCECGSGAGGHLHPDLAVVEIVDEGGNAIGTGQPGEVVVTPLSIEGMPLVRFKTGDISFLIDSPCGCGRKTPRLGPILGRKDQMIKFRGTTFYPNAIYSVLDSIPEVSEYFVIITNEFDCSDSVKVHVSVKSGTDPMRKIQDELQAALRVKPELVVMREENIRKHVYPEDSRKQIRYMRRGITDVKLS